MSILALALTFAMSTMSYEECRVATTCRIEGVMAIEEIDHVKMGRLSLSGGNCVSVSLPVRDVERVMREGRVRMTVAGSVFPVPAGDPNLVSLQVAGRRVGWNNACGDFYVFVQDKA